MYFYFILLFFIIVSVLAKFSGWGIWTGLNSRNLFSSDVPLFSVSRKSSYQILSENGIDYFVNGKASPAFPVLFKITETKQACLKSCYSADSRRGNISLYDFVLFDDKQQKPCSF